MSKTQYRICWLSILVATLAACRPVSTPSTPALAQVAQADQSHLPASPLPTPAPTLAGAIVVTAQITEATPTAPRTMAPRPTLVPTADPTALDSLLTGAFGVEQQNPAPYPTQRVTGWALGLRWQTPYQWLDNTHLLLFAFTGQEYNGMAEVVNHFRPVVIDLASGETWLPQWQFPLQPLWSDALQVLITVYEQEILLADVEGHMVQRYSYVTPDHLASTPLYLSPTGKRLWTGWVWYDLETEQRIELCPHGPPLYSPGWSQDETRLFSCCFGYADVQVQQCSHFSFDELRPVGRGGGRYPGAGRWVLDDTRAMVWWDFAETDTPAVPLIDPKTQSYVDLCESTGLPEPVCYPGILPGIQPDRNHIRLGNYVIDLRTLVAQSLPKGMCYYSSSPDGEWALLVEEDGAPTASPPYRVISLTSGRVHHTIKAAKNVVWSPDGKQLAFLPSDARTLHVLDTETWDGKQLVLDFEASGVFWQPQGAKLVLDARDDSAWWIVDLHANTADVLLTGKPFAHSLRWSPDGNLLAFVDGKDVFIVTLER